MPLLRYCAGRLIPGRRSTTSNGGQTSTCHQQRSFGYFAIATQVVVDFLVGSLSEVAVRVTRATLAELAVGLAWTGILTVEPASAVARAFGRATDQPLPSISAATR
jgi:hypothetical protein